MDNSIGRPNEISHRHRNRLQRRQHIINVEAYLAGLPDIGDQQPEERHAYDSENDDFNNQRADDEDNEYDSDNNENSVINSESEYDGDIVSDEDDSNILTEPSKKEYASSVLSAFLGFANLNLSTAEIVINLVNNYNKRFAGPNPPLLPNVKHFWRSLITHSDFRVHILCGRGHSHGPFLGEPKSYGTYLCNGSRRQVKLTQGEFFFHIPLRKQLSHHLPNIRRDQWMTSRPDDLISDISNAKLAQKVKIGQSNKLTLTLLSDEVAATRSTGLKILPIFISINEIEPSTRRDHFFLTGLFVGNTKPKADILLKPICEELAELEKVPVIWTERRSGRVNSATFHLIGLVADAPMRAHLRCVKQYNSNYGCDWCSIYAGSVYGARCYPVLHPRELVQLKRKKEHFLTFKRLTETQSVNQISGPKYNSILSVSPLVNLESFNIVDGIAVEPMHAIILGTFRNIYINAWLSNGPIFTTSEEVTFVKYEMTRRLGMIKVPSSFNRVTRGVDEILLWKSNEYDSFMEYYITSVSKALIPDAYLEHLCLLAKIYQLSHRGPFSSSDKAYLESLIYEFQLGVETLYGPGFLTYNLHILSHLPDSLINLGPNCNMSAYPLEDHMGMLKEKVNRYSGMAQSLLRVFLCRFKYIETLGGTVSGWRLNRREEKDFGMVKLGLAHDTRCSFRRLKSSQTQITTSKRFAKDMIERTYPENGPCLESEIEVYEAVRLGNIKVDIPFYGKNKQTDNSHFRTYQDKYYKVHMLFSTSIGYFVVGREFKERPYSVRYQNGERAPINFELDHIRSITKLMASFTLIPISEVQRTVLFIGASKFTKMRDQIVDPFLINI